MEKVTGHRARPAAADVRRRAVLEVVHSDAARARRIGARAARSRCSRRCLVEYQEPGDRQGDGRRVRAQRHSRATCPRARSAAGCRGSTRATPRSSASTRRRNVDVAAAGRRGRHERRRAAAHVRVHDEGRVSRRSSVPTRARKVARAHLRRVRVPDERAPQGAARHRLRRARRTNRSCGTPRATTAPSRSGPKSTQLMAAHRRQGRRWSSAARRSTARGGCGPRTSRWRKKIAKPLMDGCAKSDAELVAGDCQLANIAIREDTQKRPCTRAGAGARVRASRTT